MANLIGQSADPGVAGVLGESSTFNGVLGHTTADGHAGVAGACDEGNGNGVYGWSTNRNGVYGVSSAAEHSGVVGQNDNGTGVLGRSKNSRGVWGLSDNENGVFGQSTNRNGVYGVSSAAEHSGVVGQNDNGTGVLGRSKNSRGVWGLSDTREGVIAQTRSTTSAALVALQSNPSSPTAALHAKHDGKLTAAIFEGDVDITGDLKVQGISIQSLLHRIQQLEQKLAVGPAPAQRTISVTKEGTGANTVFTVSGAGFTPNKLVVIWITANASWARLESTETAGADGKFVSKRSVPCASGLQITVSAFEDSDPTNARATPVQTTCS